MTLYIDELVEVWKRTTIEVDAETEEQAVRSILEDEDYDIVHSTYLPETEFHIKATPEKSTYEILNDKNEQIFIEQ